MAYWNKFKLIISSGLIMTEYYFDIETTGRDPSVNKIITIQWQKLSFGRGVGPVNILKEWESSEKEILGEFLPKIHCDRQWDYVFVGDNLLFDFHFLDERLKHYGFEGMDLEHVKKRPFLNLKYTLILMNDGQFTGYTDILNQNAKYDNSEIPGLYENEEYDEIEGYIIEEAESFTDLFSKLKSTLPKMEL